jgi:hypothetical protein
LTFNIKTLKKSKIKNILVFILVLTMVFPSIAFAAAGDAPTLTPNITTPTTGSVAVTVTIPSGVSNLQSNKYSLDNGASWMNYTNPIIVDHNTILKAQYTYKSRGNTRTSAIGTLTISNIIADPPTLTPDITTPTSGNVAVTVTFPTGASGKQYSIDGTNWTSYTGPVSVSSNCTIKAKYILSGSDSEIGVLTINNIYSNIAGSAPKLSPNITTATTGKVTVTIAFPSGVDTFLSKQFSLDGGTSWMDYTGPVSITDNTTMKAMYTYLNGSETYSSQIGSLAIENITGSATGDANNGSWAVKTGIQKNYTPEADVMFRKGDIDNFGFGYAKEPIGYDPFSGVSTKIHAYPWSVQAGEPVGLDRIMVINGYNYNNSSGSDGYTNASGATRVQAITMNYDLAGINVASAKLQMFVDDFQAGFQADNPASGYYRAQDVTYVATINGGEVTELSSYINQLNQSGPIGKLITFNLPAKYLELVRTGKLEIKIDNPTAARYGDGYAIDFVKLLINPKDATNTPSISGRVTDVDTNEALSGAIVTACGLTTTTDSNGNYILPKLNLGYAIVQTSNAGYAPASLKEELVENTVYTGVDFKLKKTQKLGIPIISQDVFVPTNANINVTIGYPDNPDQKFYSISQSNGSDVWVPYTGSFGVVSNCTVKAYSASTGKIDSDIARYNITNINKDIPSAPTLEPSTTEPTNRFVIVTAEYPPVASVKNISVDGGATWTLYTGPVTIEFNTTVVAKCENNLGTQSPEARLHITNINKNIPPTPVISQDITEETNKNVTVTATYRTEAVTKDISIDGGVTWSPYTQPVVITENTTVQARCANSLGTVSQIGRLVITNINKTVPPKPVLALDNDRPTNASVNVSASYDQVAVIKEISVDNGVTWKLYSGAEVIAKNTKVQAICTNAVGTQSLIAILDITNINKDVPKAPDVTSSNTNPTNQDITVTVDYFDKAQDKQISLDNGATWKTYTGAETISAITTVLAKYKNTLGTQSDVGKLNISNIDKNIPDAPTIIAKTKLTNKDVTVTIIFPTTAHKQQVSLDDGISWKDYTVSEVSETVSSNTTVLAKYENYVSTPSKLGSLRITNINKTVPTAPTVTPSTTGVVVMPDTLTVSVAYPENAINKLISIDKGITWSEYSSAMEIKNNTTVYATYENEYGSTSDRGNCILSKFDTIPSAPTFTPSPDGVVVKPNTLTLTVNYPSNATKKYISIDDKKTWEEYLNPEEVSTNMTVYAKCETTLGTPSDISEYTLSKFDSKPAKPTFSQDVTTPTTGSVKVTIIPSQVGLVTQWSINGIDWNAYTEAYQVNINHTIIFARCISPLGTPSDTAQHEVGNIDTITTPGQRINR